jgi:hypothetical protein
MDENNRKLANLYAQLSNTIWEYAPEHVENIFLTKQDSLPDKWHDRSLAVESQQHQNFWQLSSIFEQQDI